jgi:hypothetical protein
MTSPQSSAQLTAQQYAALPDGMNGLGMTQGVGGGGGRSNSAFHEHLSQG